MILCRGLAVDGILEVHRVDASLAAVAIANEQELREDVRDVINLDIIPYLPPYLPQIATARSH